MKDRSSRILELLTEKGVMEVSELSKNTGVSQVTIRKDLDLLESRGIIHREHGRASLRSNDDINGRLAYHYEEKLKIASKAAELVSDGETVMIESGSCCALLADNLTKSQRGITIITNSAFIADFIRKNSSSKVILLGGVYQNDSQVLVGPMIRQFAQDFSVDKLFIGTDGYSDETGFTNSDLMRAEAAVNMSSVAEQVIVITESLKFTRRGAVPLKIGKKIRCVVTDNNIKPQTLEELKQKGIKVIYA
jgi:DeoR/GlpR family transcriptional regulator of sugar metabolism